MSVNEGERLESIMQMSLEIKGTISGMCPRNKEYIHTAAVDLLEVVHAE